jgi:uncharacterized delta-60 repeat protein
MKSRSISSLISTAKLLLQLTALCSHTNAAPGDVDLSFDPGSGINGAVRAVAVQPDGKVIITGDFTTVRGLQRLEVARLNADGSGDSSFNPGTLLEPLSTDNWDVYSVALQPDGKVLLGGTFHLINGTNIFNGIVRLNTNGTLDSSFNPGAGVGGSGLALVVQPDGKVLLGGNGIIRLNANGTLDDSFNSSAAGFGIVSSIALQPDGKIILGGSFVRRFHADGSLDSSFNPGTGPNSEIRTISLQSDGKVLIGGSFTSVNGSNCPALARLNTDGSLDGSFVPANGVESAYPYPVVNSVVVQPDGKIILGGYFSKNNATDRTAIARLNADGSLDSAFNPDLGGEVNSVVVQSDGKLTVGGSSDIASGAGRNRMARFNADGTRDVSFDTGKGVETAFPSLAVDAGGKVLVGGPITFINGSNQSGMMRLNANGSPDGTFISDPNFNPGFGVRHYTPHPGGDIHYNVAYPTAAAVQADGKVLVGVRTEYWQCDAFEGGCSVSTTYSVARLNADGSTDSSFVFTNVINNTARLGMVSSIAVQTDGKIVVGSSAFNTVRIARLDTVGAWDPSFHPGTGPSGGVNAVALEPAGKILIGGTFSSVTGMNRNNLARLHADGSLDDSFNPGSGANGPISSVVLQRDGKVLICGDFTAFNGTERNRIARLDADGSLDQIFDSGRGADGLVRSMDLQPDGNVLISGDFLTVNGALRPHVARLFGGALPSLNLVRSDQFMVISWSVTGADLQLQETTDLSLPNSWSPVMQTVVINGNQVSVTIPATPGQGFFRLKTP